VLAELDRAEDLYVDQIATVAIDRYARGGVALLGDAAWGGTLGGQGTALASACQKGAERVGSFFAPRTRFGLFCRDLFYRAFTSRLLIGRFEKMVKASATGFELPVYAARGA
jgi:hypothetical protein